MRFVLLLLLAFMLACNSSSNSNDSNDSSSSTSSISSTRSGVESSGSDDSGALPTSGGQDTAAPTSPPDASKPPGSDQLDPQSLAFLDLINAYRAQNGAPALRISPSLTEAAQWMSEDMATKAYLDHTDSGGRDAFTRIRSFGYNYSTTMGENIAYGNETAQATFEQWKASPGHNQNMLNPAYKVIGIGRFNYSGRSWGWYWATDFGGYAD